jgi:hypothetical protein
MKSGLIILVAILLLMTCKKKDMSQSSICNYVPAYIDTVINTDDYAYLTLKLNGYAYVKGGYRGVFLYKLSDHYVAYERASTYNMATVGCPIKIDKTLAFLNDTCSGSRFDPSDGAVLKGPATCPLMEYNVIPLGSNQLRIYYSP